MERVTWKERLHVLGMLALVMMMGLAIRGAVVGLTLILATTQR